MHIRRKTNYLKRVLFSLSKLSKVMYLCFAPNAVRFSGLKIKPEKGYYIAAADLPKIQMEKRLLNFVKRCRLENGWKSWKISKPCPRLKQPVTNAEIKRHIIGRSKPGEQTSQKPDFSAAPNATILGENTHEWAGLIFSTEKDRLFPAME